MSNQHKKSFWSSLWKLAKPVLTLGISLIVGSLAKKTGQFEEVTNVLGNGVGQEVLEQVDSLLDNQTELLPEVSKQKK